MILTHKNFKAAVRILFKSVKENMLVINAQIGNVSHSVETTKKRTRFINQIS